MCNSLHNYMIENIAYRLVLIESHIVFLYRLQFSYGTLK